MTQRSLAAQMGLGISALAVICVAMAGLGLLLQREAQLRLDKGQLAAKVHATLVLMAHEKAQLRIWAYRTLAAGPDMQSAAARDTHLEAMDQMLAELEALDDEARVLGRGQAQPDPEQATRAATIAALRAALRGLQAETAALLVTDRPPDDRAFRMMEQDMDAAEGADLASVMARALAAETEALARERGQAQTAMARARSLSLGAGALAVPGALGLALWLGLGLRRALARLQAGLAAYATGSPGYRLGQFRHREFDTLARQFDTMADEIDRHRARERDARARLQAEVAHRTADLQQALTALAASDQARTQLLADVSHGLRTPVTVIRGEAQIALRRPEDVDGLRSGLARIVDVTHQMARLIEDVLVLAQGGSAQGIAIRPRTVFLAQAAEPARLLAERQGAARAVRLQTDLPADLTLWADPVRLAQVLGCLLENAIRYSYPGGIVTLRASPQAEHLRLEVLDQGIGLSDSDLPHLFARGWRSKIARAHRPDGLGLGLAIAQDLAQAHGASLVLSQNLSGKGAQAVLDWPIHAPQQEDAHGHSADRR